MKRSMFALLAVLCLCAIGFTGCQKKGSSDSASKAADTASDTATKAADDANSAATKGTGSN